MRKRILIWSAIFILGVALIDLLSWRVGFIRTPADLLQVTALAAAGAATVLALFIAIAERQEPSPQPAQPPDPPPPTPDRPQIGTQINQPVQKVEGAVVGSMSGGTIVINRPDRPPVRLMLTPRATHFHGRELEKAQILAGLQPGKVVTVSGPGGMGKTALSAEVVWELTEGGAHPPERFPGGVFFHSFYGQPSADLALEQIARFFDMEPKPSPQEAARLALAVRKLLLALDGAEAADDLNRVLDVRGGCAALVTTRDRAQAGDVLIDLHPLPADAALRVLVDWGKEMVDDAAAAERVCDLLGRLPLGLRLAGAYMRSRGETAAGYAAWLEDALAAGEHGRDSMPLLFERSLAAFDADTLAALAVIARLAFAAFERELLAAALYSKDAGPEQALAAPGRSLGALVRYSFVERVEDGRYRLSHVLLHTYARRRLEPPAGAVKNLAAYLTRLAIEQSTRGPEGFAELDSQLAHILAVLEALKEAGEHQAMLDLAWAVDDYLDLHGRSSERLQVCAAALAAAQALEDRWQESAWLTTSGNAYYDLGDPRRAIEYYEQALAIARQTGDRKLEGISLGNLGLAYAGLGDLSNAIEYYEQALAIARETGDRRGEGNHLGNLGSVYAVLGDPRQAIEYYQQALAIARETGNRQLEGSTLGNLGSAYADLGETGTAIEYYEQALAIDRATGDRRGEGADLGNLGLAYSDLGEPRKAIEYYEQALAIARETSHRQLEGSTLGSLGNAYRTLGETRKAIEYYEQALSIDREIGNRRGEGIRLGNLGIAYAYLGDPRKAIEFHEQALAIARETGNRRHEAIHLYNLGLAHRDLGDKPSARRSFEQALAVYEAILPPDHVDIRDTRDRLAELGQNG